MVGFDGQLAVRGEATEQDGLSALRGSTSSPVLQAKRHPQARWHGRTMRVAAAFGLGNDERAAFLTTLPGDNATLVPPEAMTQLQ